MILDDVLKMHPCLSIEDMGAASNDSGDSFLIIENSGIQKLIDTYSISTEIVNSSLTPYNYTKSNGGNEVGFAALCVVKGRAYAGLGTVSQRFHSTMSTCHHNNSNFSYEGELAEQRATSKLVRKICKLYGYRNIMSRAEYNEVKKNKGRGAALKSEEKRDGIMGSLESRLSEAESKRNIS